MQKKMIQSDDSNDAHPHPKASHLLVCLVPEQEEAAPADGTSNAAQKSGTLFFGRQEMT